MAGLAFAFPARSQDNPAANSSQSAEIEALKKEIQALEQKVNALEEKQVAQPQSAQVEELDQKVRVLERQREIDKDDAAALAKTQPKISLNANGFALSSADSNFVAQLHGVLQTDGREFLANNALKGNDGILLRRARPIFSGTVFRDFDFNFTPDFGGTTVQIQDAYLNYRYNPALQLQVGKFKSPVGLEQLQSDPNTTFNERSLVTDLVPNRDLGLELHGDLFGGAASYAVGIFDGVSDYNSTTANVDSDNNKALAARVFLQPWKKSDVAALRGFGFGAGGSFESDRNGAGGLTPGYKTDGQQTFFAYTNGVAANGQHWRISPQAYYYWGPFGLLGEYAISDQQVSNGKASADLQNTAWEISGSWLLTGEDAAYSGVTPRHPFDPRNGGWGAWQLVARYAALDVDNAAFPKFANPKTSASAAWEWSAGVNWYLNKNIRLNASFSRTTFTGGNGTGSTVTKQPENAFFTRAQLAF